MEGHRTRPEPREFYRHFKGNLYQIQMIAKDSENGRELVVYQAMYPPFTCYVRSLLDFMSEVDLEKYPAASQKMRFERVEMASDHETAGSFTSPVDPSGERNMSAKASVMQSLPEMTDEELENALCYGNIEKYVQVRISGEDLRRRGMMMFFDADSFRKKRQIFMGLRGYLDQVAINNIAVTLDLVLEEGDMDAQYDSILKCLGAMEHYEGGRLR